MTGAVLVGCSEAPSILTVSVIAGSSDAGEIVCGPSPGISKAIVSGVPVLAFAFRIACRSDPAPLSFVLVTRNVCGPTGAAVTARTAENSDVLSSNSAVAVTVVPPRFGTSIENATEPSASVVTFRNPSGVARSEEHTSELQSRLHLVCRLLLEQRNE